MTKEIFTKDPEKFIAKLAEELKKIPEFELPHWVLLVKSGTSRERPPVEENFWFVRASSILRQLYIHGVVGVGRLRIRYGSRKKRGGVPAEFRKSGGKIIRTILQQAERAGLVEKVSRFQHGRRLSENGKKLLDSIKVESEKPFDYENVLVKRLGNLEEKYDAENEEQ